MIPLTYRKSPTSIVSYDFQDIANGTGIEAFYLGTSTDSSGIKNNILQSKTYTSSTTSETTDTVHATFIKVLDLDFDLSAFNGQRIVRGKSRFHFSFRPDDGIAAMQAYIILKLIKYDGVNETQIGTIQTATRSGTGQNVEVIEMDLTKTKFNKGDIMRLTVEGWAKHTASPAIADVKIWHEPASATEANIFECLIPFEIEV